jgi:DNA-binding LacI/PurR family transcriptional regulator
VDVVVSDDVRGGFLATQHLTDLGHRRLAHVGGDGNGAAERELGFRRAVEAAGIDAVIIPGGYNVEDGADAMQSFIAAHAELPTAIFAANDLCAVGVMNALRDAGRRVPADISVIGFDDIALAGWRGIELTTINQSTRQMGELAARLLTTRIAEGTAPQQVQIEPALVMRSTTRSL